MPRKIDTHHARSMSPRPSATMTPHDGVGGGMPTSRWPAGNAWPTPRPTSVTRCRGASFAIIAVTHRDMADIFLSYASADRDRARALADALAVQGWSVWWDRTIPPGRQFDEVIEEELAAAGCVVVLWSKASVVSSWVKTEAAEARDRRILVPVLIEDAKIPLEFKRLQAADLSGWRAGPPPADDLFRAIAAQLRQPGQSSTARADAAAEPAEATPAESPRRPSAPARSPRSLAAIGGVAIVAGVIVAYLAYVGTGGRRAEEPAAPARPPQAAPEVATPPAPIAPPPSAVPARPPAAARPRPAPPSPIDISGRWRDTTWGHVSQITQNGEAFQYTVWGAACRGNFQSSGTGTIRGNRVESTYRSTMPSEGRCSGTVSADGTQIRSTCVDSVCGSFPAATVRQ